MLLFNVIKIKNILLIVFRNLCVFRKKNVSPLFTVIMESVNVVPDSPDASNPILYVASNGINLSLL